jgi:chemotaxis protein histidine kinase CheA
MIKIFLEEYDELLDIAIESLTAFSSSNKQVSKKNYRDSISNLLRVFHTLRGNSAYFDFRRLKDLSSSYCEFFRLLQDKDDIHQINQYQVELVLECLKAMTKFKRAIKRGRKGGNIPVAKLIKAIDVERKKMIAHNN